MYLNMNKQQKMVQKLSSIFVPRFRLNPGRIVGFSGSEFIALRSHTSHFGVTLQLFTLGWG